MQEVKALNGNKMKCIGDIDPFSNTGLHEVSYVLSSSQ
jgi:hypothetical protein